MSETAAALPDLPDAVPTPGMLAAGAVKTMPGRVSAARVPSNDDELPDLPDAVPTPGMVASGRVPPGAPKPAGGSLRGVGRNIAAGAVEGAQGAADTLLNPGPNLLGRPLAMGLVAAHDYLAPKVGGQRFPDDVRNMLLGDQVQQPVTAATNAAASAVGGVTPDEVPANGTAETVARKAAAGAVGAAALSPVGVTVPAALGASGAVAGHAAGASVPDWLSPLAETAGNVAGAAGVAGGMTAAARGVPVIVRKAGEAGIGFNKQNADGTLYTKSQQAAVGGQVAKAIGPEGRANVAGSLDAEKAARDAQAVLNDPNAHPDDRADAQAVLKDAGGRRVSIVPGGQATTAQLAGTQGASDLELATRRQNPVPFQERAQQNNNAQVQAIEGLAPADANPGTLGESVARTLAQLDQGMGNQVAGARADVAAQPAMAAGQQPIGEYGAQMREQLVGARDPWVQRARQAWSVVDPDGTWAIQNQPLRDAARQLQASISPSASINGDISKILDRAASLPGRAVPFSDLSQMRADANAVIAKNRAGLSDNEYRLLTGLKGGIDQTIASAIDAKVAATPGLRDRINDKLGQASVGGGTAGVSESVPTGAMASENAGAGALGAALPGHGNVGGAGGVPPGLSAGSGAGRTAKPPTLVDWLIANGGVQDQGGNLAAMGADTLHHQMGGRLVNPKGMTLDRALEGAQTEGFLGRQGGNGPNPIGTNDLIDAIGEHISGRPTFRAADIAQAHAVQQGQQATQENQAFAERLYDARDHVNAYLDQAGLAPLKPAEQEHAARLVATGAHPEDAVRSAATETENAAFDANAAKNAHGSPGMPLAQQSAMDVDRGAGIEPNMTADHALAYQAANAATRDMKQRFGTGGVGKVLQRGNNFEDFKTPDGAAPKQIFTGNGTEPGEVAHWIDAVGGVGHATDIGRHVLVNDLRAKGIVSPTGHVDANKLGTWMQARRGTLQQFPQLVREFGTLRNAQANVNELTARHVQAVKDFQDSAAAKFIGQDPKKAFASALGSPNPTQAFRSLVDTVQHDPAALASLKRIAVDFIREKHASATPSSEGYDFTKAGMLRKFIETNKGPLREIFGGQGMNNLEMVGAAMRREAAQPTAIGGSQTSVHEARAARTGVGAHVPHGVWPTALAFMGEHIGSIASGGHGGTSMVAGGAVLGGKLLYDSLKQAKIRTKSELLSYAMLHPEFAKAAMERADAQGQLSTMAARRIAAALQGAITSDLSEQHR